MLETQRGAAGHDLEKPIRAIREISHDLTCRRRVRLANGREASALEIQSSTSTGRCATPRPRAPAQEKQALAMWEQSCRGSRTIR